MAASIVRQAGTWPDGHLGRRRLLFVRQERGQTATWDGADCCRRGVVPGVQFGQSYRYAEGHLCAGTAAVRCPNEDLLVDSSLGETAMAPSAATGDVRVALPGSSVPPGGFGPVSTRSQRSRNGCPDTGRSATYKCVSAPRGQHLED